MKKQGYLYIATGQKYIDEAVISAESLKRLDPHANTCLITDSFYEHEVFDQVIVHDTNTVFDQWKSALLLKIYGLLLSPFEKTLFVDSDTYFFDPCTELFDMLDYHDLLIGHDYSDDSELMIDGKCLANYTPYNTGVMAIRINETMKGVISDWHDTYKKKFQEYWSDQPALMDVLLRKPVKMYFLHTIYNFRHLVNIGILAGQKVKILHARGSREDFQLLEKKLNHSTDQRAWIAPHSRVYTWPNRRGMKGYVKKLYSYLPDSIKKVYQKVRYR
ncbi:putative nucleotide-diphospho-sugar transferase [Ekhidna sp.]|uniref:putative nucleotide-diphospho-sugar transferase n=1 Tax=Ekhidna sp. TaxID=2608089 RepID=UPI003517BD16